MAATIQLSSEATLVIVVVAILFTVIATLFLFNYIQYCKQPVGRAEFENSLSKVNFTYYHPSSSQRERRATIGSIPFRSYRPARPQPRSSICVSPSRPVVFGDEEDSVKLTVTPPTPAKEGQEMKFEDTGPILLDPLP